MRYRGSLGGGLDMGNPTPSAALIAPTAMAGTV